MKNFTDMPKGFKIALLILLSVAGFLGIPIFFCFIFHSEEQSQLFGFIPCNMSVSDWFSFWSTYLAAISSMTVALCSLRLTRKIEEIQLEHRLEEERLKFRIMQVQRTSNPNELKIVLPLETLSITVARVSKAFIIFDGSNNNDLNLELQLPKDNSLRCNTFCVSYQAATKPLKLDPYQRILSPDDAWKLWYYQQSTRTPQFREAELCVNFEYISAGLRKRPTVQTVYSRATVSVKLDETGIEYFDISSWAVYNKTN